MFQDLKEQEFNYCKSKILSKWFWLLEKHNIHFYFVAISVEKLINYIFKNNYNVLHKAHDSCLQIIIKVPKQKGFSK